MAGIARAHARAAEVGIRLAVGCLDLRDGLPVVAYPLDRAGRGRMRSHGLLCTGKGGARRARAPRAGGAGLRQRQPVGLNRIGT